MREFVIAVVFWGAVLGVIFGFAYAVNKGGAGDSPCYAVIDRFGGSHESYYPPQPLMDAPGFTYTRDDEWGIVFEPAGTRTDRDCLRERGVPVTDIPLRDDDP